jgi:hypothetical protein
MQLEICVNGHSLLALLGSGSTHNYINADTARYLQLQTIPAPDDLKVAVLGGPQISNVRSCHNLQISIGPEQFTIDCYSIPLGDYDIILAVNWLSSLGPIMWDFANLTMKFWRHGRPILWIGCDETVHPLSYWIAPTTKGCRTH